MDRVILHCDCNAFYASVECLLRPELREVPMAVCGDPESRHGVILAKNELAKKFGVQTAETIWQARRKCPNLVLAPAHRREYVKYSRLVNAIYGQYTDLVEPFGIDESWLDVTGSRQLFGTGRQIADQLRARIRQELGLTISVGVSFNKVFAKLGSDYRKPDATTEITRENFRQIVWPLPAGALLYVGQSAQAALAQLGVTTIGQLAAADRGLLEQRLGKMGGTLHDYANGLDEAPVRRADDRPEVKSVGNNMTFKRNLTGLEDIRLGVAALCDSVAARLRAQGLSCRTVQVVIKDPEFRVISRQKPLEHPTHLASELRQAALEVIRHNWDLRRPIRMLSVTGLNLTHGEEGEQLSLFGGAAPAAREKRERLEAAMDQIRRRYGKGSLRPAGVIGNDLGLEEPLICREGEPEEP